MTYNFTDNPTPFLTTIINAAGDVELKDGTPQGDLITPSFSGSTVSITITPPDGWSLDSVVWTTGGDGTYPVPETGTIDSHNFTYAVSQGGATKSDGGTFKIKKDGT